MRLDIITCLPELFDGPLNQSIVKRAQQKKIVEINIHNLRDYSTLKHKNVDDYSFGGGAGMVLMIEPIESCLNYIKSKNEYKETIYLSPDGETLNQKLANRLSLTENMILLCGHYKGIDQRVRDHLITREISIGDYVLSGGELAAMVLADALIMLVPGVLNDESSALTDSFQTTYLRTVYTRPADTKAGRAEVLTSGHEANVEKWRHEQAVARTKKLRPDLLE